MFIPIKLIGINTGNFICDSFIFIIALLLSIFSSKYRWAEHYRKNINMSEYLRALILIDNRMTDFQSNIAKANKNLKDISRYEYFIGRHHE